MGTCNFSKENASKYYAIIPSEEDAEFWNVNDDLRELLPVNGFEPCDSQMWSENEYGGTRMSRDSFFFGRKWIESADINGGDLAEMDIVAELCFTPGYYEGGTLDYDLSVSSGSWTWRLSEYDSVEDMADDIADTIREWWGDEYADWGGRDKLYDLLWRAREDCENACKYLCDDTLECIGMASNGGAFYRALVSA